MIRTYEFSSQPHLVEGWDFNHPELDYESERAGDLAEAAGALSFNSEGEKRIDDEYALARHPDGRWGLFGLQVEGHRFAVEVQQWVAVHGCPMAADDDWQCDLAREAMRKCEQKWAGIWLHKGEEDWSTGKKLFA